MLSEACELWIRTGAGKDPGIAFGEDTATLALERMGYDCRPAASNAGVDDCVDEGDKLVWKSNSDLLAHPKMVANW